MKNVRIKLTTLAALALAFAMVLTSCGAIGDFVVKSSFPVNRLSIDVEPVSTDTEAATEGETELLEAPDTAEPEDDVNGGEEPKDGIRPPEADGELSTPLVWHVVDPKTGGELYLLGSMHAGLSDMCLFPDEIYAAFDHCDVLAVESDVIELEKDAAMGVEGMRMLVYQDGTKISDHISADLYAAASKFIEEAGYPSSFMDYYMPILWQQVIDEILTEQTPYKYENGVDRYFLYEAKRIGKEIVEVEEPLDTYKRLAQLSEITQEILLEEEIDPDYIDSYGENMAALYAMWKRGDLEEIDNALTEEGIKLSDQQDGDGADKTDEGKNAAADAQTVDREACYAEYNDAMLGERNVGMISKAQTFLEQGDKVFYVVGLAHMVGDDGIVAGLEALGYTVELMEFAEQVSVD